MKSERLYELSRVRIEQGQSGQAIDSKPSEVRYERTTEFNPEFTMSMPCRVTSIARYVFNDGFNLRSQGLDTYLLLYIYSGTVLVQTKTGHYTVGKGEALFLHMIRQVEVMQVPGEKLDVFLMQNSGYLSESYYEQVTGGRGGSVEVKTPDVWEGLLDKILYYMRYPTNLNNVLMVNVMSQLYTELYMNKYGAADRDTRYSHPRWFIDSMEYIEKNYSRSIQVKELADRIEISESHFYKIFKEYTGVTPYQYLIQVRLNHARTLLTMTDFQIKYISATTGFDSVSHFIRHFKRQTNLTPTEYRKRHLSYEL